MNPLPSPVQKITETDASVPWERLWDFIFCIYYIFIFILFDKSAHAVLPNLLYIILETT